ncbi:MAG TPA: ATP-binding cassette domain-containing protein [Planctomycetota bacterium]
MIRVSNLHVHAGAFSLCDVSFEIDAGQYVALMGKTGAGKTTLIECICGLREIKNGSIELHGRDVTALRPGERGIGYVPQDIALFSTMTVFENLAFAMHVRKQPDQVIGQRVEYLAEMLGIAALLDRRTHGLSGGEAQRVALGRALAAGPGVLCLDEPLNALDSQTHEQICTLLKRVSRETGVTTLHVTHNLDEARRLADRTLLLENGKITEA